MLGEEHGFRPGREEPNERVRQCAGAEARRRERIAQQSHEESDGCAASGFRADRVDQQRQQQKVRRDAVTAQATAHRELQQNEQRHDHRIAIAIGASHCGGASLREVVSCPAVNALRRSVPVARGAVSIIT